MLISLGGHWSQDIFNVDLLNQRMASAVEKTLIVFDFDHTVIDGNTDTHIQSMYSTTLPPEISELYTRSDWTDFMAAIFDLLHSNNITIADIQEKLFELPLTTGMDDLFAHLSTHPERYESVIISDSNTLFIEWIMKKYQVHSLFDRIYSNPAYVDEEGKLRIVYFHENDWCSLSSKNMCKGMSISESWPILNIVSCFPCNSLWTSGVLINREVPGL